MMEDAALCFPPVGDRRTKVLILGSLPGVRSLALSQYYGHPRNHFWPILAGLTGIDLPALPYEERLRLLLTRRLGLWDVVAEAVRPGSLDQHLRSIRANSLGSFVEGLPDLLAIGFNGATASRIGRRQLEQDAGFADRSVALIDLPSTSPANTMPLARKAELWRQLAAYID